jgi:hypothetical protein
MKMRASDGGCMTLPFLLAFLMGCSAVAVEIGRLTAVGQFCMRGPHDSAFRSCFPDGFQCCCIDNGRLTAGGQHDMRGLRDSAALAGFPDVAGAVPEHFTFAD